MCALCVDSLNALCADVMCLDEVPEMNNRGLPNDDCDPEFVGSDSESTDSDVVEVFSTAKPRARSKQQVKPSAK